MRIWIWTSAQQLKQLETNHTLLVWEILTIQCSNSIEKTALQLNLELGVGGWPLMILLSAKVQTLETLDLDLGLINCDIFMLICNQKSKSNTILEKQTPSVCFIVFWEPSALPWILIYYELLWNNCFPFIRITYIYMQYTHM